jgi:tRNA(Ile)-lysidine synthase
MPAYPSDLNRPLAQLAASSMWEHVGGGALVIACSGGPDSVALALAARELLDDPQFAARFAKLPRFVLWHLDHGIREQSKGDAAFVEQLAEQLRAECIIERVQLGTCSGAGLQTRDGRSEDLPHSRRGNLEAEARTERYTRLIALLHDNDSWRAVTGHHLDDQAETVLHHLIRGTHLAGLRGISPVYRGIIYRPWLELRRAEMVAYLESRSQKYVTDETNADTTFTRNRLRHEILPLLEQINPGAIEHIARLSVIARDTVHAQLEKLVELEVQVFNADELARWLPLLGWPRGYEVHRVWEGWVECGQLAEYTAQLLRKHFGNLNSSEHALIDEWAEDPDIAFTLRGLSIEVTHPQLITITEQSKAAEHVEITLDEPISFGSLHMEVSRGPKAQWQLFRNRDRHQWENMRRWPDALAALCSGATNRSVAAASSSRPAAEMPPLLYTWECYLGEVALPLRLRTWRVGERMQLAGGGSSTVGDLFTNAKVPEPLRAIWCVLADANDNALWIPGIADGAAMRIEGEPKHLVKISIN